MNLLEDPRTNWQYILIIVILATFVGQWTFRLSMEQKAFPMVFSAREELKKTEEEISNPLENLKQENKGEESEAEEDFDSNEQFPGVIRNLDKELIYQKITQGKEFLYRMENKDKHGFYKRYDAINDSFENRLHTVYSASIIYTFLYIYDLEKDEEILEYLPEWGNFLLSMQNQNKDDKRYGAFHYSYYLHNEEREKKFVVGTSALSIFTLLRLYDLTDDSRYLESAKLAGNWLITMQEPDGLMKPYIRYSDGKWVYGKKESLLYEGQVLSSLSKLYNVTGDEKYYETAERIAQRFAKKYEKEQGYIQGEYRKKNPISNAWVVMSLTDFYRVSKDDYYKNLPRFARQNLECFAL